MLRRLRHRRFALLRISMVLLLALGMTMQPVLAALGEGHELAAHGQSAMDHSGHTLPHDAADTPSEQGHAGDPLHALLHYAHCCGTTVGIAGAMLSLPMPAWRSGQPEAALIQRIAAAHPGNRLRPPISS